MHEEESGRMETTGNAPSIATSSLSAGNYFIEHAYTPQGHGYTYAASDTQINTPFFKLK